MKLLPKIFLVVLIPSVLLVLSLRYAGETLSTSTFSAIVGDQQLQLTRETLDKIDRSLAVYRQELVTIAETERLEEYLVADPPDAQQLEQITAILGEMAEFTGPWRVLHFVDGSGVIIASTRREDVGRSVTAAGNYGEAFRAAMAGTTSHSDVVPSRDGSSIMIFGTPVRAENETRDSVGAVIAEAPLGTIEEIIANVPYAYLFDSRGTLIAPADAPRFRDGLPYASAATAAGFEITVAADENHDVIVSHVREQGYKEYAGNNWVLLIEKPLAEAIAPMRTFTSAMGLMAAAITLVSALCIIALMFQIIRPIQKLTAVTSRLAKGDFSIRVPVRSNDEIGMLGTAFNTMAQELQQLYTGLEEKVREQTQELQREKNTVERKVVERTQQLSYEQDRLKASINGLSVGYVLMGPDNSVVLINTAAEDIFTLSTKTASPVEKAIDVTWLKGKIDTAYIQMALRDKVDLLEQIADARRRKATIILKDIQYKVLYLNLYITPVISEEHGQVIGTVLLIEDITDRKAAERSRDEFFSIASHELRTPLTAIRGNTALIRQYYAAEINNPEVNEILSDIHESSVRLINIVNDFLDLSRLEQGKIMYVSEPFKIELLCREILKEYDVTGSRKKLDLRVDYAAVPIPLVYADKGRVRQVLVNLLGNAIKFTESGGVTISFETQPHHVKVFVTDTGKGIPAENRTLLFRKFQQAQSNILTRDTTRGTGLGLYISKLMITAMGGEIRLERTEMGKGSVFSITVPIATDSQKRDFEQRQTVQEQTAHG